MKEIHQLPDVQKSTSGFPTIPIEKVGVRNIKVPIKVRKRGGGFFHTVATVSSYCDLVGSLRGINMSRISRTINEMLHENDFALDNMNKFVTALAEAHQTNNVWIKAKFEYIWEDKTPITGVASYEPVDVIFESVLKNGVVRDYVTVTSTEMSVCPCSKEMSLLMNNLTEDEKQRLLTSNVPPSVLAKIIQAGFGAHGQKSVIDVKVELDRTAQLFWIEDIVGIIQRSASSPTWSTLKRPDEKFVTEVSYTGGYYDSDGAYVEVEGSGPKFVEDIARAVATNLNKEIDKRIRDYCVVVNNQESIHSGDILATAVLTAGRDLK